mgnify:CR=1 FL=1
MGSILLLIYMVLLPGLPRIALSFICIYISGSAVGFKLDSLLKLSDTRAINNKMTLMHYLCKVEYFLWYIHSLFIWCI